MEMTVSSILEVYTGLGGQLTDTYEDIAGGIPVAEYSLIPDAIQALAKIAGSTVELPAVSGSDNGKVLKVIEGKWAKGTDESLPAVSESDNGKALIVSDGAWGAGNIPTELPAVTSSDNGKELRVISGKWQVGRNIRKVSTTKNVEVISSKSYVKIPESEFEGSYPIILGVLITTEGTSDVIAYGTGAILRYSGPATSNYIAIEVLKNERGSISALASGASISMEIYYTSRIYN